DYSSECPLHVDFIKMDVQGAEAKVLRGMQDLLRESRHLSMLIEFWPLGMARAGDSPDELIQFLVRLGFTLEYVNELDQRTEPVAASRLLREVTVAKGNQTNLLATKGAPASCGLEVKECSNE